MLKNPLLEKISTDRFPHVRVACVARDDAQVGKTFCDLVEVANEVLVAVGNVLAPQRQLPRTRHHFDKARIGQECSGGGEHVYVRDDQKPTMTSCCGP